MNRHTPAERAPVRRRKRIGEVAGGTAAGCAAVWCCCPCATLSVLVLALYKVPAGLCRRAWAHRKSKLIKKKKRGQSGGLVNGGLVFERRPSGSHSGECGPTISADDMADSDAEREEEEMWGRFSTSGFWRSPSQREDE